jgi:hypothetical protein
MNKANNKKLELKFCDLNCSYSQAVGNVPSCYTANPIYCEKIKIQVPKGKPCADYNKK